MLTMSALARSLAVASLGMFGAASPAQDGAWPQVEMPAGSHAQVVAADLVLNGRPCRIIRFEVASNVEEVLQFYRSQFRVTRAVETQVNGTRVIASRRGDHFQTVQLQAFASAVQGTVITTALLREPIRTAASRDTETLLPPDTAVVSLLQSRDRDEQTLTAIAINLDSVQANHDRIVSALRQRGFRVLGQPNESADTMSITLSSPTERLTLTVTDAGPYRTVLIQRTKEAK
jgi:hypothetical protein